MTLHIEDDHPGRYAWIETALQEVRAVNYRLPEITHPCPNCGCPVKYPLIARQSDLKIMEDLKASIDRVCEKHGITVLLLQEVLQDIRNAKRKP